ncbi:MAG: hypothetical protein CM15mV47_140 [uncultured marine virus]|nr:MAG: hypothetical protein CM15mV47_140 [uncultured marine virus]
MASEWTYVRTNSKGEPIFRRDTNEDLDFVEKYLSERNINYDLRLGATMMYIYNNHNKRYAYYWTTGRWSAENAITNQHYHSKGIDDFVSRFLNRFAEVKEDASSDV